MPHLDIDALPDSEYENAHMVQHNLAQLWYLLGDFSANLSLFEHATDLYKGELDLPRADVFQRWQKIAGIGGAIILQGTYELMGKTTAVLNMCPILCSKVDPAIRRKATKIFRSAFPGMKDLRDSAAHPEFNATRAEWANNRSKDHLQLRDRPVRGYMLLHGAIVEKDGRAIFASTVDGRTVTYPLERSSYDSLSKAVNCYWDAFTAAAGEPPRGAESLSLPVRD